MSTQEILTREDLALAGEGQALALPETPQEPPALVYLASLSRRSQRVQRSSLNSVARLLAGYEESEHITIEEGLNNKTRKVDNALFAFPWGELRYTHVLALRSRLQEDYEPQTINRMLSAVRGVMRECRRQRLISPDELADILDVKAVKGETLPAGRMIDRGEIQAMVDVCLEDKSPAGVRDGAIIGLLWGCGVRRSELVNIDYEHVNEETGEIKILKGKGSKDRKVWAANGTLEALTDWLEIRGREPGPLFCPILRGNKIRRGERITAQAAYLVLEKRAYAAGLTKSVRPHDLRRTFASEHLEAGVDPFTLARSMGHANIATTQRYDLRPDKDQAKMAQGRSFPWRR